MAGKPAVLHMQLRTAHPNSVFETELRDEPSTLRSASEGRKGPP
ncbi:hypothetical protein Pd630_LPD05615 [Rhodococcus opacus PD630]|nr:hypothetical protein Pd630_LPD05615 [Rhodococcus opacus PD630]EJJ00455.1 hypothetical protein JVH1_2009 [Rhodococcus sp. JVH1]